MTTGSDTKLNARSNLTLPKPLGKRSRFLQQGANPSRLIEAAAENHLSHFTVKASEVHRESGATWLASPNEITVAFPHLTSATADAALDAIVAECFRREPARVGCWSLTPTRPYDLGVRLAARGFEWGWKPHWMALNLQTLSEGFSTPAGLTIAVDNEGVWDVDDLPYYSRPANKPLPAGSSPEQRRTWRFGAWLDGKIVGQIVLHVTTGALGVAGIYNVGVVPAARRQGIGRAITAAACRFAKALGCHYALLNSATDIYDRIGFVSLGHGQSWWMNAATLAAPPPTSEQIVFAEAIGRGSSSALNALEPAAIPNDLDAPLPNGMTPLALAIHSLKPARSAEWLIARGATMDILQAWDLGWRDKIPALLAKKPELVDRRTGNWGTTPLHEAAMRDDLELAKVILAYAPDLTIKDTGFNSTPLGWANHFQRIEIVRLIEAHSNQ